MTFRKSSSIILLCFLSAICVNSTRPASHGRLFFPFFGGGPVCNQCPQHYCDDDPAVVHGFCCGCARYNDNLPIRCSPGLKCPINNYDLCEDYDYMMKCCCS